MDCGGYIARVLSEYIATELHLDYDQKKSSIQKVYKLWKQDKSTIKVQEKKIRFEKNIIRYNNSLAMWRYMVNPSKLIFPIYEPTLYI